MNLISFFFIFLPLFFSERTPVRSGQPHRGSFSPQRGQAIRAQAGVSSLHHWACSVSAAGPPANALRGWCVIITPLDLLGIVQPYRRGGHWPPAVSRPFFAACHPDQASARGGIFSPINAVAEIKRADPSTRFTRSG